MTIAGREVKLSGAVLKNIAVVLMITNHFFCMLLDNGGVIRSNSLLYLSQYFITRVAFIAYAFLLSEGMKYTRNRGKYIIQLLAMAFASELLYDELFFHGFPYWGAQNVFFTLFLGTLAIFLIDKLKSKPLLQILVFVIMEALSIIIDGDYAKTGVVIIVLFYYLKNHKMAMLISVGVFIIGFPIIKPIITSLINGNTIAWRAIIKSTLKSSGALLALPLIYFYDGTRGKQLPKLFYYLFYPGHLLVLLMFVRLFL